MCDQSIKFFSLYKLDALGHCFTIHSPACICRLREKWVSACCASNKHKQKKSGEFFLFFQIWWIFFPKKNKNATSDKIFQIWKTKIFSHPSIVLATYGKPNSEIWWFFKPFFSSLLAIEKPSKFLNFKIDLKKFLCGKKIDK